MGVRIVMNALKTPLPQLVENDQPEFTALGRRSCIGPACGGRPPRLAAAGPPQDHHQRRCSAERLASPSAAEPHTRRGAWAGRNPGSLR